MNEISVSIGTLLKIVGAWAFASVLRPILFVFRDLVLHGAINKFILTKGLNSSVIVCEHHRWMLNNKFNEKLCAEFRQDGNVFKIGENQVQLNEFERYKKQYEYHQAEFQKYNREINMKHNLIVWLTKHYNCQETSSPIPEMRKRGYQIAENDQKCA